MCCRKFRWTRCYCTSKRDKHGSSTFVEISRIRAQGPFAVLIAYAAGMPLVVSASGLWFIADIVTLFQDAGRWAALLFAIITAGALVLALLPSIVMSALAGALFGLYGVIPAVGSYLIACIVSFEVVRRYLQPQIQSAVQRSARASALQQTFHEADFKIIFLSRLSPAIPFAVMNILLGVSNVSRSTYLWGSFAGMLPRTIVAVLTGAGAQAAFGALSEGELPGVDGPLGLALPILAALGTAGLIWVVARAIWSVLAKVSSR